MSSLLLSCSSSVHSEVCVSKKMIENEKIEMTKSSMTNSAITLLGEASADEKGHRKRSGNAQRSRGCTCAVEQRYSVAKMGT